MKINKKFEISKKHDGSITTNLISGRTRIYKSTDDLYSYLDAVVKVLRRRTMKDETKNKYLIKFYDGMSRFTAEEIEDRLIEITFSTEDKKAALAKLIDFFTEFNFAPSLRFVNTIAFNSDVNSYITNYFLIQDFEYANEIADKIKSREFKDIITRIRNGNRPTNVINNRMKLYYGEPGTGKTTQAMKEADKCIVCSSDMLPTDLMQNFAFQDGKAGFEKSDLWIAMEEGKTINLDEINMLPFESLRFLQGITDGKEVIDYKGFHITIKPGFQIIGTMNLTLGGVTMGIPAPLVDRCSDIKKFSLNAECLMNALL